VQCGRCAEIIFDKPYLSAGFSGCNTNRAINRPYVRDFSDNYLFKPADLYGSGYTEIIIK